MLDFDYLCVRKKPSVAGIVYEFTANHYQKFYWNKQEVGVCIYIYMCVCVCVIVMVGEVCVRMCTCVCACVAFNG